MRGIRIGSARFAVGITLALAGCSTDSATEPTTFSTPTITSAPANSALKPIKSSAFQAVVEQTARQMRVPGAVVVLRTPQGNYTATVGTTELGAQTAPTTDTHFRIASNTKTMTAALIVLLAQDGKLRFSDPVAEYLPNVPNGNNITIAELLKMRSGLYNYTADPDLASTLDADPSRVWRPDEVLAIAFRHPPQFAPDASYDYCNTNYAMLGLIAEKVAGLPLADQIRDRLLRPVGLLRTTLPAAAVAGAMPTPYSHGYMYGKTRYALADAEYPADVQAAARAGTLVPIDYTHQNSSYATAAGGAISTADDLATWIRALVSGQVFNADYHQQWLTSVQAEDPEAPDGQKYGYGISYQRFGPNAAMYYHGGELPGFNSFIGYDPENNVSLVIWTNLTLTPEGRTTANAMLPAILDQIYPGLVLPTPAAPTTTR